MDEQERPNPAAAAGSSPAVSFSADTNPHPHPNAHPNAHPVADSDSSPPSRPSLSRSSSHTSATSNTSELDGIDLTSTRSRSNTTPFGNPLSDLIETFFEPHIDLTQRRWNEFSYSVKRRAKLRRDEILKSVRAKARANRDLKNFAAGITSRSHNDDDWDPNGKQGERDALRKAMEQEVRKMRRKVVHRVDKLQERWQDAKTVRLRDKICFVIGIMNLVISSLTFAFSPQHVPLLYGIQSLYFLPLRIYSYQKLQWHYFLYDYCYFAAILNLVYLYIFPSSKTLFLMVYCSAHGPLAFSVATWRNSFVPHSLDKMISLFIHIYPPFVFTTIVHFIPREISVERYPAIKDLEVMNPWNAFFLNVLCYAAWQFLYYEFITIPKKQKIESGQRINSYSTMTKGKGAVANLLGKAPKAQREPAFMLLQFSYTIITTLPAPLIFFPSSKWSAIFLLTVLTIAVWNGASFYVEVFGRRFEKELIALRKEMEAAQSTENVANSLEDGTASTTSSNSVSRRNSQDFAGEQADIEREGEEQAQLVLGNGGQYTAGEKKEN